MNEKNRMEEEWRDVAGYEGLYEVSDSGCVRRRHGGKMRYLKCHKAKNGYCYICLCKNGKMKRFFVHRIVYTVFVGNIPDGLQIDHLNGKRDDNRLENLRCVTPKDNVNNPVTRVRYLEAIKKRTLSEQWQKKTREARHKKAVLQLDKNTGEVVRRWECIADAGRELKVNQSHISKCCRGKSKSAYGFRWRFENECESAEKRSEKGRNNIRDGVRRVCAKPVLQINKDTDEVIREWECARDAARELEISAGNISECCHGKKKTAGGFRWKFATDDD